MSQNFSNLEEVLKETKLLNTVVPVVSDLVVDSNNVMSTRYNIMLPTSKMIWLGIES